MTNSIIRGIARKIGDICPGWPVHDWDTPQDLNPPAFNVRLIQGTTKPHIGGTWERRDLLEIVFFPPSGMNLDEIYDIFSDLSRGIQCVEDPVTGERYRGYGLNGAVSDGVLVITVTYLYYIKELTETAPPMEVLDYEPEVEP